MNKKKIVRAIYKSTVITKIKVRGLRKETQITSYLVFFYKEKRKQKPRAGIHTLNVHGDVLRISSLLATAVSRNHGVDSCTSVRAGVAEVYVPYGQHLPCLPECSIIDFGPCISDRYRVSRCNFAFDSQRGTKLNTLVWNGLNRRPICKFEKIHLFFL